MILASLLVACLTAAPPPPVAQGCTDCHGSAARGDPAPPVDLGLDTGTDAVGVGAHQAHLRSAFSDPVPCAECHHVPAGVDDPLHIDVDGLPAEVTFADAVVGTDGVYDPVTYTCTVSCHKTTDAEGTVPAPSFTQTGADCTWCHGDPPSPATGHPNVGAGSCQGNGCHPHSGSGPLHVNGGPVDFQ